MREKELINFKDKLEGKRDLFEIESISEVDWYRMVSNAKKASDTLEVPSKFYFWHNLLEKVALTFGTIRYLIAISTIIFFALIIGYGVLFRGSQRNEILNNSIIDEVVVEEFLPIIHDGVSVDQFI